MVVAQLESGTDFLQSMIGRRYRSVRRKTTPCLLLAMSLQLL